MFPPGSLPAGAKSAGRADPAELLDVIDLPLVVVDRDEAVARFNSAAASLFSLGSSDVGRPLRELRTLAAVRDLAESCTHVIGGGSPVQCEVRDRSGSWFLVRIVPCIGRNREIAGAVLNFTNVTVLHASVEQAIREREYTKAILNTVSQPLVVLGADLKVHTANRAFYATFGTTREETEGALFCEPGRSPWDVPALRALLEESLSEGRLLENFELEGEFRTIGRRTMLLHARRLSRSNDPTPQILVAVEDVTIRKDAERREQAARQAAEAASRAKDEFLAVLSHELRTPLSAVYGWARILKNGGMAPDVTARALDVIMRNAKAQVRLIDDMLDMSRIVTGKMRLVLRTVDLRTVVEAALDAVRPAAEAREIRLQGVLGSQPTGITGDPDRLQQVVWNLLINAVKFTPQGGRVGVQLRAGHSDVEIVVSDTGKGIDPEVLPYVFDRFRQAESNTTRQDRGLGLGLALVRHLVELHGGQVQAHSAGEGQGSTFTVRLPITDARLTADAERDETSSRNATSEGALSVPVALSLRGLRVLVVDDDQDGLDLVATILTQAGAEARSCNSSSEGMQLLTSWRPGVLVSDIEMPGEDGYAFIRKVRALDAAQGGRMPAVALTAHGRIADRLRALSAGFSMHVPKPVDPAELVTVIASLVGR